MQFLDFYFIMAEFVIFEEEGGFMNTCCRRMTVCHVV